MPVNVGIAGSVRAFVHALHDAGGTGRYPGKIRQAQQIIAAAVSQAAALSPSGATVREIADELGLDAKMIAKCRERYNSLVAGDWEQLFDDRSAVRSDTMPKEHKEFALQFWTDELLTDADGQARFHTHSPYPPRSASPCPHPTPSLSNTLTHPVP